MARTIRVLHLRDTYFLCGPGKTVLETVRRNPDVDVEYEVCAFGTPESNPYLQAVEPHCPVFGLPESKARLPLTALQLARIVRRRRYDLLHPHEFKTRALCVLAAPWMRVPLFTTTHGYIDVGAKGRWYNRADRRLLRRMDEIFVVSEAMMRDVRTWNLDQNRLRLVRNSIVLDNYPYGHRGDRMRRELGWTADEQIVGHIGRLSAEKGQLELVEGFAGVRRRHPRARLVLAGDGPDRRPLERKIDELGLQAEVRLLGHRDRILDVYGALDLLVLNSHTEGMPNVVLEAMALGVPVVATAVGGTPELVRDGDTGWLVPAREAEPLIDAICAALAGGDAAARAERARAHVEREFDMMGLIRKTHDRYRAYLAAGQNGGGGV